MEDKIYIPVTGVQVSDLFDWSDPVQKCKQKTVVMQRGLARQTSQTGSVVECNEEKIALFRYHRQVYAIRERCPHAGGPLHLGDIEDLPGGGLCVRCPWHSWRFDLDTGQVKMPKGRKVTAKVFPVKVKPDGSLLIGFDKFADVYFSIETDF
ncbi:Rieske domain-containing protein-like [Haliotis asinina]|uniref:Rieske domain-containing protein-like n=1 Tax=Haliotis asinina TaxID=109174 RepID=UPI0035319B60